MFTYLNRKWHWFDYSIVLLRLLWYIMNIFIILILTPDLGLNKYIVVIFFTISYAVPQFFHVPKKTSSFGFILSEIILTGSLFVWITNYSTNVIDLIWNSILSIAFLSTKKTKWWAIAGLVLLLGYIYLFGHLTPELFISYLTALILFGTIGLALRILLEKNEEQKLLLKELHLKNVQLVQLSDEIEYLTLKEERNRIAQELHDAIGHTFTATIVGVDAIASLIDKQPDLAKEQANLVSSYAREGLEEIRKYVHALPLKEEIPIDFVLKKVITSFRNTTGVDVLFIVVGEDSQILPKNQTVLFIRCLQESLTNALKHGQATKIAATLHLDEKNIKLTVKDNGMGKENLALGFGLSTMKQRMEELGGIFRLQSGNLGTVVEVSLPRG